MTVATTIGGLAKSQSSSSRASQASQFSKPDNKLGLPKAIGKTQDCKIKTKDKCR